ncbi:hypothetical protein [Nocardiopsis composta]|uniref:Uncharacterized protein n=1 Tax=Nocardiopsis composta TaxID=157465 RepID=A0A7W8QLU6_9ACTN|nr:hypothetical protein [Nocardiopsis composta]MBB5432150.1 hypothetical protein [Nocardiopsis composta]
MTDPFDEGFEERLRAALHAEADSVEPSPEALATIRERTERRMRTSWFGLPWLRPALAVGAAAAIAGTVLMGTPQFRDQLLPASFDTDAEQGQEGPRDLAVSEHEATDDTRPEAEDGSPGAEDPADREDEDRPGGSEEGSEEGSGGVSMSCVTPEPGTDPSPMASSREGGKGDRSAEQDQECDPEEGSGGGTEGGGDGHPGENPDPGGDNGGGEDPDPGEGDGGGSPSPDPGGDDPGPGSPPDVPVE